MMDKSEQSNFVNIDNVPLELLWYQIDYCNQARDSNQPFEAYSNLPLPEDWLLDHPEAIGQDPVVQELGVRRQIIERLGFTSLELSLSEDELDVSFISDEAQPRAVDARPFDQLHGQGAFAYLVKSILNTEALIDDLVARLPKPNQE